MNTILLCLLCMRIVQSSRIVGPMNKAVVAGQRMEMECKTNNVTKVIEWINQRHPTHKIFTNFYPDTNRIGPNSTHFGADVDSNGSGFIYTNSTRLEDAGNYTCRVQEGQQQPVPYNAQLIVLEKDPLCETNQSSDRELTGTDSIWFMCRVNFSGNWAPTMEWRQHYRNTTTVLTDGVVTTIIRDSNVTSTLSLPIHSIVHSNSLCNISCKIHFAINISNTNAAVANNVPDYSYIWNFCESQGTTMLGSETVIDPNSPSEGPQVTTGADQRTDPVKTILIIVLTAVGLVVAMVVVCCLCCACYKKKITEFLIQMAANAQGGSVNSNPQKRLSRSKIPLPRPPHAYTPMQIGFSGRPTVQESQPVQLRCNGQPGRTTETGAMSNQTYSIVKDEQASSYATLSRGVQPPSGGSVYARKGRSVCYSRAESTYDAITESVFMESINETCTAENKPTCSKATAGSCAEDIRADGTRAKATAGCYVKSTSAKGAFVKTVGGSSARNNTAESSFVTAIGDVSRPTQLTSADVNHVDNTNMTYSAVTDDKITDIYEEAAAVNAAQSAATAACDNTLDIYDEAIDIDQVKSTDSAATDNTYSAITDSVYTPNTDSMYSVVNNR